MAAPDVGRVGLAGFFSIIKNEVLQYLILTSSESNQEVFLTY